MTSPVDSGERRRRRRWTTKGGLEMQTRLEPHVLFFFFFVVFVSTSDYLPQKMCPTDMTRHDFD
jgi:hypothetical protein